MSFAPEPRPIERERPTFIAHIARLEQRIADLERELATGKPVEPDQGAGVVIEPEPERAPRRRLIFNHSVRQAGSALGGLSFDQALNAHRPGVSTQEVAQAAGVTCPSVSRWRIANGLVSVWVLKGELPDDWRDKGTT